MDDPPSWPSGSVATQTASVSQEMHRCTTTIQIQSQPILEKAKRENRGLTAEEVASLNGMITVQIDTAFERSKTIVTEAVHAKEGDEPAQAQAKVEIGRSLLSFLGRAFHLLKESLKNILSQLWRGLKWIASTIASFFSKVYDWLTFT